MKKAKPIEGPRAPLFILALPILTICGWAEAQPVDRSTLEVCASLETAELKLACFEAIIATGTTAAEPAVDAPPESVAAPVDSIVEAVESDTTVAPKVMEARDVTPPVRASENGFGSEHLEKTTGTVPDVLTATVVEVTRAPHRGLSFHLANGQIWRQIEPRFFSYPKGGAFEVTISTGIMGDYRLRVRDIDASGRMVRIRRVR